MASHRYPRRRSQLALALLAAVLCVVAAVATHTPTAEAADDVDLLRKKGGQPYVFFLIDTSGSMVLSPKCTNQMLAAGECGWLCPNGNCWVPVGGDDPRSKLYQVKEALYDVLKDVEGVHFGLAGFNQDRLRVQSKHWLYRAESAGDLTAFEYPAAAGVVWNFGRHLNATGVVGTCESPVALGQNLERLDRFAKLGVNGGQTTTLWVTAGGTDHRIVISLSPDSPGGLGSSQILVRVEARRVIKCSPPEVAVEPQVVDVAFRRVTDFLMVESNPAFSDVDGKNCTSDETMDGLWDYTDVMAENTCGSGSSAPFTGKGWEGNTDSGDRTGHDRLDACCVDPSVPGVCVEDPDPSDSSILCNNLRFPTTVHPVFPELDKGDQIPLHWDVDYQDEFLRRLNPKHPLGRDFRIAAYFQDAPDTQTDLLRLKSPQERPLIGFGNSPLGRAVHDFRCWYLGDSNKCKGPEFDPGWEAVFRESDLEYGCRVPYFIIVSDGEDNSKGENPSADTADLFSKSGVRSWTFTFEETAQLRSMARNGKGELILVNNGRELATEVRKVIGFIQEDSRTFASAAVPSVQAAVEDKIYLTQFTPLDQAGVWDGHVHSFLKPRPIDQQSGRPDTSHSNHLWDAGVVMLEQAPDPVVGDTSEVPLQIGHSTDDQRRVFWAVEPDPGAALPTSWPQNRRLFDRPTGLSGDDMAAEPSADEASLWEGFGLTWDPDSDDDIATARRNAHTIIEKTLIEKTYSSEETGSLRYILGDIFHSNPLVIGSPVNSLYFIADAEETFLTDANGAQSERGTGYREFFLAHENRRKVVVAGANDGMVHAWDAGKAEIVFTPANEDPFGIARDEVKFDRGSGREIFAYMPRSVLPTVREMAQGAPVHRWSVDGSIAAGDVFIDPLHTGTPDPDEREWRTVMMGGLREGGSAYYLLDVTHPDHLTTGEIGPTDPGLAAERREVQIPSDLDVFPDCLNSTSGSCPGPIEYGSPLWEFTDRIWDPVAREQVFLDEDGNGLRDLGETWSTPDIGRIRVIEDGNVVNKYVAIFGGGLDPEKAGARGNFLYIVDVETGQVLYKREVEGSVPADPAAVDTDQDSFIDRVYFGTTAGLLYRLDLVDGNATGDARFPELVDTNVLTLNGPLIDTVRIDDADGDGKPLWQPKEIFTTGGRPIYFPPTVQFVAKLGRWALGFGTGDRDALGFKSDLTGRFYTIVDDSELVSSADLPFDETLFTQIDLASPEHGDLLTTGDPGGRGWFMVLDLEERLISPPAGLIGITFFATFDPQVVNETCEVGPGCNQNPQCSLSGNSRVYVVETATANPLLLTVDDQPTRFMEVSGFVTEPFTEQGLTGNLSGTDQDGDGVPDSPNEDLTEREREIMESMKDLMPSNCKFGDHRIDIKMIGSDT
ncbi:MAG TPA: PilC/PilY family type IV pilus protein, partial [Thermoanaerobaculia bacterium]|nr:PilC/PilY family type IV pilus protein [Thermoanaerobaculia bacterium]